MRNWRVCVTGGKWRGAMLNLMSKSRIYLILCPLLRRQSLALKTVARAGSAWRRSSSSFERRRGNPMAIRKTLQHPPTFSNHWQSSVSWPTQLFFPGQLISVLIERFLRSDSCPPAWCMWTETIHGKDAFFFYFPTLSCVVNQCVICWNYVNLWYSTGRNTRISLSPITTTDLIQSIFYLCQIAWKTRRLILVATAGSATTGPLELPALGADVGPKGEIIWYQNIASHIHIMQISRSKFVII